MATAIAEAGKPAGHTPEGPHPAGRQCPVAGCCADSGSLSPIAGCNTLSAGQAAIGHPEGGRNYGDRFEPDFSRRSQPVRTWCGGSPAAGFAASPVFIGQPRMTALERIRKSDR
jgi:hypothetical protein